MSLPVQQSRQIISEESNLEASNQIGQGVPSHGNERLINGRPRRSIIHHGRVGLAWEVGCACENGLLKSGYSDKVGNGAEGRRARLVLKDIKNSLPLL